FGTVLGEERLDVFLITWRPGQCSAAQEPEECHAPPVAAAHSRDSCVYEKVNKLGEIIRRKCERKMKRRPGRSAYFRAALAGVSLLSGLAKKASLFCRMKSARGISGCRADG